MRAGKLRHRVQIQERVETKDAHGGITESWSTVVTRYASIEPLSGRELFEAQKASSEATVRIKMRYYSGLTTKHRLVFG